jgi:dienelactone hydrolase
MIHSRAVLSFALVSAAFAAAQQPPAVRTVDLKAPDGTLLKASYFAAAKPGPGVLLMHQCNRQRKVWDELAGQLTAAGINVLTFDLRGFGESGGTPNDKLTPQEVVAAQQKFPADVEVAYQYLVSQPGVKHDDIGVGGASCGVGNSIEAARKHPQEVKSMVLMSGPTDYRGRQFLRSSASPPGLFAIADDDEFPPSVVITQWLYGMSANPGKRYVHYATGGHGTDMFKVHPEFRSMIVDWYVETLIKTPGKAAAQKDAPAAPAWTTVVNEVDEPGGAERVAKKLAEARQSDPKAELFPEFIVNLIGYDHLQAGDSKGAVEIMKLNAAAFPQSANVYDSLSDAYLADGQKDLARQSAKRAIETLATDTSDQQRKDAIRQSAEQKLKQLVEK